MSNLLRMKSADVVQGETPSLNRCACGSSSEQWLDLSFRVLLPWSSDGIQVEAGDLEQALLFMDRHYPELFGFVPEDRRWLEDPMTPAKRRFLSCSDIFLFKDNGETVGIAVGEPSDWKRYYVRTLSLLPPYRGRSFVAHFFRWWGDALKRKGIITLEGDVSPVNVANILTQTKLGAVVTGVTHTVRWGSMLHFTIFLDGDADATFRRQYCAGISDRSRDSVGP